jgi:hypothetical protein
MVVYEKANVISRVRLVARRNAVCDGRRQGNVRRRASDERGL